MILADGLKNPEAPVLLPDGTWALTEMHLDRGWILRISADGSTRSVVAKTGRPNGMTLARTGDLWVAESLDPPSLLRVTLDGAVETLLTGCDGEPFLFPNDLRFGPDGALYMTDSGIPVLEWHDVPDGEKASVETDGRLYRIDVAGGSIRKLDSGIPFANGVAFGPDNDIYVSATQDGRVYRYDWSHDGRVSERREVRQCPRSVEIRFPGRRRNCVRARRASICDRVQAGRRCGHEPGRGRRRSNRPGWAITNEPRIRAGRPAEDLRHRAGRRPV